jgi:hypothetical protein
MTRRPAWWRWLLVLLLVTASARVHAASALIDFARCLNRAGATYYTAEWCPHCARQNKMFGGALGYLNVVDCTRGCDGPRSFPAWRFRDGTWIHGVASFEALADRTGCRPGQPRTDDDDVRTQTSAAPGTRMRYEAGAKIIEVPRR